MPHPFFDVTNPTIIGHRGAAGSAPENTLTSFARALELGAEVLESDVHVTSDAVPVLIHDPSVDRTTNGHGPVVDYTLSELQELDAGQHFSTDGGTSFPQRAQGVRVPTLEEAFEAFPNSRFNLEIKASPNALVGRVIDLVEKFERSERTLLTAGDDAIMLELRREKRVRGSCFAIGASMADILAVVKAAVAQQPAPEDVMALQIPDEFGGQPLVTPDLVRFAHDAGIAVHVWTINEPEQMRRILALGADGLVTDYPERMAALLGRS